MQQPLKIFYFLSLIIIAILNTNVACALEVENVYENTSQYQYSLLLDNHLSAISGSSIIDSTFKIYQYLDDWLVPSTEGQDAWLDIGIRFIKFSLIESTLASTAMVVQHEIFGHGARAREFHLPITEYRVRPWSGYTEFRTKDYNNLAVQERISFITGGIEATGILANELKNEWLATKTINSGLANLYLKNKLDQTLYVLNTRHYDTTTAGNDIFAYVNTINDWYGKQALSMSSLRRKILFDFADPYLFYSLYTLYNYIASGEAKWEYPMIKIGNYSYLPAISTHLSPYGLEYQLMNYLKTPQRNIKVGIRYGQTVGVKSLSLGLEITKIWEADNLQLDARTEIWRQPKLLVSSSIQAKNRWGGSLLAIGQYRLHPSFNILGQLGFKTKGYIPGEFLKGSPLVRLGFSWQP